MEEIYRQDMKGESSNASSSVPAISACSLALLSQIKVHYSFINDLWDVTGE